jgi:hypothetical protein
MGINKAMLIASAAVLGTAGAAQAATVGTDSVGLVAISTSGGSTVSSHSGPGTGTLDDSGTYTATFVNAPGTIIGKSGAQLSETDTFTGTYSGGVFTPTGGTDDVTACTGSPFCSQGEGSHAFSSFGGTLTTAGGTLTAGYSTTTSSGVVANSSFTYTAGAFSSGSSSGGAPTVPLPPAVWLLGSGLLGLVGTARRRKA